MGSKAVTVRGNVPLRVGVPESTPVGVSVIPGGSDPVVTAKVTAPVPPVAENGTGEYEASGSPDGSEVGEIVNVVDDQGETLATYGAKPE